MVEFTQPSVIHNACDEVVSGKLGGYVEVVDRHQGDVGLFFYGWSNSNL